MARQIGLKRLGLALLKGDVNGTPQWDKIEIIKQAVEISTTNVYSEYAFYSDDTIEESAKTLTSVEVGITLGYLTNELKAKYLGVKRVAESGFTTVGGTTNAPQVAIVYEITKSNGESDYKVIYNCKLAIDESTNRTKEDSITGVEVNLTGVGIPCPITGDIMGEVSTDDNGVDIVDANKKALIDAFFENVQTGQTAQATE